jgi:hypothetical protein
MTFLWTKSNLFGGKADVITMFLRQPVSHFGILFSNQTVIHWSFKGFQSESFMSFLEHRNVVYSMDFEITKYRENKIFNNMMVKYENSLYDYGYLIWLVWRAFLLIFGIKIPYKCPKNDMPNNMICHEGLEGLPKDIRPKYDECRANTPYRLYLELKKGSKNAISKD